MREKIRNQASTRNCRYLVRSYILNQLDRRVAVSWVATLAVSLGLAGSLWFATEVHTTQIAQAETYNVGLSIDRRNNESYESLVNRAEALAKATVDESFAQNQDATDVSITVVGRHHGAIAPILSLKVGRDEWSGSAAQRWMTHFSQARSLLYFDEDTATNSNNQQQTNRPRFRPQLRNNNTSSPTGNPTTIRNRPSPATSTFSQPGRPVDSSVPGQTSDTPFGQPSNTTNTTNPSAGQNPNTFGGNSTSQPLANPNTSPNQPQNSIPATGSNSTAQPLANPNTSPNQSQNSIPGGVNLTPQQPLTPSSSPQSQNQLNNTNSIPTNSNTIPTGSSQGSTP